MEAIEREKESIVEKWVAWA